MPRRSHPRFARGCRTRCETGEALACSLGVLGREGNLGKGLERSVFLGADRGDVNEHAHLSDACASTLEVLKS